MEKIVLKVSWGEEKRELSVDRFSSLKEIADIYYSDEKDVIIGAFVDKKLSEMSFCLDKSCEVEFISLNSVIGTDMYRRSMTLLMLKSFSSVLKGRNDYCVHVLYSLGRGYFCRIEGGNIKPTAELINEVKEKMIEIVSNDEPIIKETVGTQEAAVKFSNYGLESKQRLFKYRRNSKTNVYKLGNYEDYFYGYMVPSTGYLKSFDLIPYDDGFVLVFPEKFGEEIKYKAPAKLYEVLKQSDRWGRMLGADTVGKVNDIVTEGGMNDLILVQEALMEKQIGEIAEKIKAENKKIVLIAGPSSSGKTTFSHRLSIQLRAVGLNPHPIALDNYFCEREETPKDENGNYDFECLGAMDLGLFNSQMKKLLNGETVEIPRFNFNTGKKEYKKDFLSVKEDDVLICEGIHALNPRMTEKLPDDSKYKVYISALTMLNVDEHNRIATTDARLIRRIVRDARTRGNDAQVTIGMWQSVRRGEEKNIFPYQEEADVMFNSSLIYELYAIKLYAEPLLFKVPRESEAYYEARRLLKFLDYFLSIDTGYVPKTSIIREFIGGGCFDI